MVGEFAMWRLGGASTILVSLSSYMVWPLCVALLVSTRWERISAAPVASSQKDTKHDRPAGLCGGTSVETRNGGDL